MTSLYASKPWLRHYRVPHRLALPTSTLRDSFAGNAAATPHATAIQYFDRAISFAELDDLSTRMAALLARLGIGPGDRVALSLQNNPQFAIAQLGAWKRGAAIVPVSPMYQQEELEYQLIDSGAKAWIGLDSLFAGPAAPALAGAGVSHVITTSELDFLGPGPLSSVLAQSQKLHLPETLDFTTELARMPCASDHVVPLRLDDLAHIVYTSGTTGKPKGAMGLHRHIAFNSNVFRTWMDLQPGQDSVLGMAPLFHITGLVAHLGVAMLAGIPLVLFHRFHPGEAFRMARRYNATFSVASITAYLALRNHPDAGKGGFLAKCFTGGAAVAPAVTEDFERHCGCYIHNTYGLTEVNSPSHSVPYGTRAPVHGESGALAIGVPIPNCEARIVDTVDPSRVLPPGEPGELLLKGPFVFEGYWNKPEATRAAFHDGWFLTGDVAIMDADGWFYIVDRKKDMINASGYKVWPREVEDVLYRHPAVREAAVVGVPDAYRGESVKAVLSLRPDYTAPVTPEEIVAFCRQRLAPYKAPRVVEFLDDLPKTPSGKFLRRALRT
ncbi:MAG: AMP-binding protein [Bryobacterales bacterium]|nr:AMP-binding protein [Bryobacterales bacterium]